MKVSILKGFEQPEIKEGVKDGKAWRRVTQTGYLHLGGPFPEAIRIPLNDESEALPIGDYKLSERCIRVNQYGDPEFNKFEIRASLTEFPK